MNPLLILLIGLITVIVLISALRWNPFLALLAAALAVSFLSPAVPGTEGSWEPYVTRVGVALGEMAGKIAILIAMGAIIGQCMTASGAADRIVLSVANFFGKKRMPEALMSGGFLLSIPVFYDVTFYLLLPLAKGVYRLTQKNYILYLLAIGFGATLSHTLIPPTPGPLMVAETMRIPIGTMMIFSLMVGVCTVPLALGIARFVNWYFPNPKIEDPTVRAELAPSTEMESAENAPSRNLPPFCVAILPILLPVLLIATGTISDTLTKNGTIVWLDGFQVGHRALNFLGSAPVALMLSALISVLILQLSRNSTRKETEKQISTALHSAGMIILITSAGGAFGSMLRASGVGDEIRSFVVSSDGSMAGLALLLLVFGVTSLIKTAQGSSTVAMVTSAGIFSSMPMDAASLGFHPAYIAVMIGVGSCVTGWMNDSGFCVFAQMSGVRETDALRTWTVGLALLGLSGAVVTLIFSQIFPCVNCF